jgi:hypothetical protein
MLGLAAGLDDDGMSAGEGHITQEQADALRAALVPAHYPESMLCSLYKVLAIELLPADKYDEAVQHVKKRQAEFEMREKNERASKDTGVAAGESRAGNG